VTDNGPPPDQIKPAPDPTQEREEENPPKEEDNAEPDDSIGEDDPGLNDDEELGGRMPLLAHLAELRTMLIRIVLSFLVIFLGIYYPLKTRVLAFLLQPYLDAYNSLKLTDIPVRTFNDVTTALSPQEVLFTDMKAIALVAIFIASPLIFYQIWKFVSPGLYRKEKRAVFPVALASTLFFVAGAAFCYFVILRLSSEFLIYYALPVTSVRVSIAQYFSFALKLVFAFGLAFELPIVILILARAGIVDAKFLWTKFRWALLLIALFAAVLTPPDWVSQSLLGIPLVGLYILSIGVAAVFGKKKPQETDDDDEEEPEPDEPAG